MINIFVGNPGQSESIGVRAIAAYFVKAVIDRGLSIDEDLGRS